MALRAELKELLNDFEKRMKFINIVRCLLDYKYPEPIKAMFPNKLILDNIIVAVLVFIKDRTLEADQQCTISNVQNFLDDLSVVLPFSETLDTAYLAKYIIVDVLQNGGILTEFLTFNSKTEVFEQMPVRLLNEERGNYHLTDDAFDFLFRSKEIESELDYSVTRFRMKEYMRRDNYREALEASRELVSRIRNMKISMDDFLLRCRENISKITVDQYEDVIKHIRNLLEEEYEELKDIQEEAKAREISLEKAQESGVGRDDILKSRLALREIIDNITLTIEQQRVLINKKTSLADAYQDLIRGNFSVDHYQRLNFEKDIMAPLRSPGAPLSEATSFLLFCLTSPSFEKQFSIENFYAPQGKLNEETDVPGIDISAEDTDYFKQLEIRNTRNQAIVHDLFHYARGKSHFLAQDFVSSLSLSALTNYCEDFALPNVLLSIFSMQELDIEGWSKEEHFIEIPNGEFELSWCMDTLPEGSLDMKSMTFSKLEKTFSYTMNINGKNTCIDMTDFEIEVIR